MTKSLCLVVSLSVSACGIHHSGAKVQSTTTGGASASTSGASSGSSGGSSTSSSTTGGSSTGDSTSSSSSTGGVTGPSPCLANQYVSNHSCTACASGSSNSAGDDPSGADTTCTCVRGYHSWQHTCAPCPTGFTQPAGDDPTGAGTFCQEWFCELNQFVASNVCVDCPSGEVNAGGNIALGSDTTCSASPSATMCFENQYVQGHKCFDCEPSAESLPQDSAGADTTCLSPDTPCAQDQYVSNHVCTDCPDGVGGTTNAAGDDPALGDTTCDGYFLNASGQGLAGRGVSGCPEPYQDMCCEGGGCDCLGWAACTGANSSYGWWNIAGTEPFGCDSGSFQLTQYDGYVSGCHKDNVAPALTYEGLDPPPSGPYWTLAMYEGTNFTPAFDSYDFDTASDDDVAAAANERADFWLENSDAPSVTLAPNASALSDCPDAVQSTTHVTCTAISLGLSDFLGNVVVTAPTGDDALSEHTVTVQLVVNDLGNLGERTTTDPQLAIGYLTLTWEPGP